MRGSLGVLVEQFLFVSSTLECLLAESAAKGRVGSLSNCTELSPTRATLSLFPALVSASALSTTVERRFFSLFIVRLAVFEAPAAADDLDPTMSVFEPLYELWPELRVA